MEQRSLAPSGVQATEQQPPASTGSIARPAPHRTTSQTASLDPSHFPSLDPPCFTPKSPKPAPHAAPPSPGPTQLLPASQSHPTRATVHRTHIASAQDDGLLPDLALLLCHSRKDPHIPDSDRSIWDPYILFPELGTPPNKKNKAVVMTASTKAHMPAQATPPPNPLHRTTRERINKNASSHSGLEKLDIQAFVDVPLQYVDGLKILQSIGATGVSIPPHLMTQPASDMNQAPLGPIANVPESPKGPASNPSQLSSPPRPAKSNTGPPQDNNDEVVHLADP